MQTNRIALKWAGALSACVATAALATPISVNPVADALVSAANPNSNYGGAGALQVSGTGTTRGEFQSLLRFDAGSLVAAFNAAYGAGQWGITYVGLQLTAASPNNPLFNTSAAGGIGAYWMQNDTWTEGTGTPSAPAATGITFATLPGFLSGADASLGNFSYNGATSGLFTLPLDLHASLTADIISGGLISLRLQAASPTVSGLFNARSFGTASARPVLIVEAAPTPEPAILPAASVMLAWGLHRRGVR